MCVLKMIVFALFLVVPLSVVAFEPEVKEDFVELEALYEILFKNYAIKIRNDIIEDLKNGKLETGTEIDESKLKEDFIKIESKFEKLFFDFKKEMKKDFLMKKDINMKEIKMAIDYVKYLKEEQKLYEYNE